MSNEQQRYPAEVPMAIGARCLAEGVAPGHLRVRELTEVRWSISDRMRGVRVESLADDVRHNNTRRARSALAAVEAFAEMSGGIQGEQTQTFVGDLVVNLRHLCDALGLDWEQVERSAGETHQIEVEGREL